MSDAADRSAARGNARTWPDSVPANFFILAAIAGVFFWKVFTHPAEMFWANDIVRNHYTHKLVQWQSLWHWHAFPLWDPTSFCGKSIVGDSLTTLLNPFAVGFWLISSPILFGFFLWSQVTLGSWGMFLFAREKRCDAPGALVAAVAFALSGKTAAHLFAGHVEVVTAVLGLPWILWTVERALRRPGWPSAALFGAVLTLVAFCGSIQMLYYHGLFVGAYLLLCTLPGLIRTGLRPGLWCLALL